MMIETTSYHGLFLYRRPFGCVLEDGKGVALFRPKRPSRETLEAVLNRLVQTEMIYGFPGDPDE